MEQTNNTYPNITLCEILVLWMKYRLPKPWAVQFGIMIIRDHQYYWKLLLETLGHLDWELVKC